MSRTEFGDLSAAVEEMERLAREIKSEGPLDKITAFRDYDPGSRVHARLELAGRGLIRPPSAGVDVMGDGRFVPYSGGLRRKELELEDGRDTAFRAVERELRRTS